ncbi:helix-turn-helix transcriptional regulator [Acinetobacter sp. HY1485]|uniref:helix-turn-helix transcriptional regulator n=1 Tax=Acinetobacter sp. HY1485 TaxID=2970918 RepID=UPI0022B964E5|nr:helix-turn-helix transcriptional regulator [Acinetobacter sp. HY1485]
MNEVRDRIIARMKTLNLKQVDLVQATGLSKGTISKWLSGMNIPSNTALPRLAHVLQTTSEWLISGQETHQFEPVDVWDDETPLEDDEVEIKFFKDFRFACGAGNISEALESEGRKLRLSKITLRRLNIEYMNAVATTAEGDSMAPTIKDGDTIHIDTGRTTIKDGRIFAVCHGGLFKAKRLYNLPMGGIRIVSDNSVEFPEERLTAEEIQEQQFEIIGWIWQIASLERW